LGLRLMQIGRISVFRDDLESWLDTRVMIVRNQYMFHNKNLSQNRRFMWKIE
jgi:hypothetical protein